MDVGICRPETIDNLTTFSVGTEVRYFYQPCVGNDNAVAGMVNNCFLCYNDYSNRTLSCTQFCDTFKKVLPLTYFSVSFLSAICCLGVIATYFCFPRLRRSGYSSKVFLYRTLVDLVIALGHIVAMMFHLSQAECKSTLEICRVLGVINETALVASNMWYVMLAMDLIKAIRNPFSSQPSYKLFSQLIVWGFSFVCGTVLVLLTLADSPGQAGPSMFYWCWVSVGTTATMRSERNKLVSHFAVVTLLLYYFWHFVFWIFSLCVLIAAAWILRGQLAVSSETRKFVLKQNFIYVLVLGIETAVIMPIWIAQLSVTKSRIAARSDRINYYPYYFSYTDLGLAIAFAIIHSLRGTIDFFVWLGTFTIGISDIKYLRYQVRKRLAKKENRAPVSLHLDSPVITRKDSAVNRSLRRNAVYCINIGILDAMAHQLEKQQQQQQQVRIKLDDDSYIDASLMQFDDLEEKQETRETHPYKHRSSCEQNLRKIQFPSESSSLLGITCFSFIDLEPSVFNMLRNCYGVDIHDYRTSFRIRNAADIERGGMLEKFTEGKSGSFFYFTRDFKYIIKTVTDEEEKFLQKIAYRYYDHMKNNPNSLIVRFFGLHKVRLAREQRFITVVVMENIFHTPDQFKMHERYDLKGSRVGRRSVKKTSKVRRQYKGTLKDLDLGDKKVHIGADSKGRLLDQLRRDVEFLIHCKIMDYSLLLGIHHHSAEESARLREAAARSLSENKRVCTDVRAIKHSDAIDIPMKSVHSTNICTSTSSGYGTQCNTLEQSDGSEFHLSSNESGNGNKNTENKSSARQKQIAWFREDYGGLQSTSTSHPLYKGESQFLGPSIGASHEHDVPAETYYFGIVDILQEYNLHKKAEHIWKTKIACQDEHWLSCVNEREYGERFLNFMDEIFD